MKKNLTLLSLLIFFAFNLVAQTASEAPRAATLGSGVQPTASLYTGQMHVNIPIYTTSFGKITVPIALSYNSGGIKPNEHPGWVGLNWNLIAGGFITRKVNDLPDDYNSSYKGHNEYGYHWKHSILRDNPNGNINFDDNEKYDTEPDEFYFNVNGMSGKFFKNENGVWLIQGNKTFDVSYSGSFLPTPMWPGGLVTGGNFQSYGGFTITTDDGMKYVFGGNTSAIQYSIPVFFNRDKHWTADTWYLTQIITPEGYSVSFSYGENGTTPFTIAMNQSVEYYKKLNQTEELDWFNKNGFYQGLIIRPVYLRQIDTEKERIVFEASNSSELRYPSHIFPVSSTDMENKKVVRSFGGNYNISTGYGDDLIDQNKFQWQKLDKIWVFSKSNLPLNSSEYSGKSIRQYNFSYNNNSSERLKLAFVSQVKGGREIKTEFDYYIQGSSMNFPNYCDENGRIDHWGFYNNISYNLKSSVNAVLNSSNNEFDKRVDLDMLFNDYSLRRESSDNLTQAIEGTLKSIIYPTGGKTEFLYQQHNYYKKLNDNNTLTSTSGSISGGLRIYKIREIDGNNVINEKEYDYLNSGIQSNIPKYYHKIISSPPLQDIGKWALFMNNYNPLTTPPVTYSEVKEIVQNQGHVYYKFQTFHNTGSFPSDELPYYSQWGTGSPYTALNPPMFCQVSDRDFVRGVLLQKDLYGSSGKLLNRIKYEYGNIQPGYGDTFAKALKMVYDGRWIDFPPATNNRFPYYYKMYNYIYSVLKEEIYDYDMNTGIADDSKYAYFKTEYDYNFWGQIKEVKKTYPDGKVLSDIFKYPTDFSPSTASITGIMKIKNIIGVPLEVQHRRIDGGLKF